MFKKGDFLIDQNSQLKAYVLCVGEVAYFLRITNLSDDQMVEQLVEKQMVEKRFYLSIDQEMGKLLYLHSPNHVCGGVPETSV